MLMLTLRLRFTSLSLLLCSTFFLVGPISQAKKLIDRSNLVGTIIKIVCIAVFVVSVVLVFCAIFWVSV